MKKRVVVAALISVFLNLNAYASDSILLSLRGKLFSESQELKASLASTQDVVLVSSMWDSCIITLTQIDAYFSMLGIFNTIKKENASEAAADYLSGWLNEIKRTNDLNIKSLESVSLIADQSTKDHMEKLKSYFFELNTQIAVELKKVYPFAVNFKNRK